MSISDKELVRNPDGTFVWIKRRKAVGGSQRHGHFASRGGSYNEPVDVVPTKMPDKPLTSYPGTLLRVHELEQRAARGEHLWHPDDVSDFSGFDGDLFKESIFGQGARKRREDAGGKTDFV